MASIIEAIFEGGLFRPVGKVHLKEGTHVEVRIPHPVGRHDPRSAAEKLRELAAKSAASGPRESTARNHDRIIYGGEEPS
jgi:predicted DNA-binding antitoxin AbrB/MazE fold protein